MKIFKKIRQALQKLDLFSASQFLRFKGQAESKTLTGGIVSLTIVIFLLATFSSMIVETFDKILIQAKTDSSQANEPIPVYLSTINNASKFMLGVQVWHHNLAKGLRYFDIKLQNTFMNIGDETNQTIQYQMQPCTKDHWTALKDIDILFDKVQMNTWLCMPLNITPVILGKYSSDLQTSLTVTLSKCKNGTDPSRPCAPQSEIDAFMQTNGQLYFTPYFLNPLINPQNQEYLSYYLQDRYYTMFGPNYGMEMYIYNADYSITTDQSILPFQQYHSQNGSMISLVTSNFYMMNNSSDVYSILYFYRASESYVVNRKFQKLIDAFSYVGGLLGAILILLIIINFYNESAYQMIFASSIYKPEKKCPTQISKFNIFYYLLQLFYSALKTFKFKCGLQRAKFFYQTREQIQKQLDVKYLLKRLHVLESTMNCLLTKSQQKGIMLFQDLTLSQANKIRKKFQLKKKINKYLKREGNRNIEFSESGLNNFQQKNNVSDVGCTIAIERKETQVNQLQDSNKRIKIQNQTKIFKFFDEKYSGSSSSSSSNQQNQQKEQGEQNYLEDLIQLKAESKRNETSREILQNMDPFIKKIIQVNFQRQAMFKNCIDRQGSIFEKQVTEQMKIKKAKTSNNLKKKLQNHIIQVRNPKEKASIKNNKTQEIFQFINE